MTRSSHLVIDTDIGTDVDDAVALLQLLGSEMVQSFSITTVYGDTKLRAQIARRYCTLVERDIEIYPGEEKTLSGKAVWTSGLEGSLHTGLNCELIREGNAVDHLLSLSADFPNELTILAIAPLTNIANAIQRDPEFASRVSHLYMMGGRFGEGRAEHNIVSDLEAARIVFQSEMRISVVGIEVTSLLQLHDNFRQSVASLGKAGNLLAGEIEQWSRFWSREWIVPHDSIAALMLLAPELFEFSEEGEIKVSTDGSEVGRTEFVLSSSGSHRIVRAFDIERGKTEILSAIARAAG